jgi:hypothetical protein
MIYRLQHDDISSDLHAPASNKDRRECVEGVFPQLCENSPSFWRVSEKHSR